MQGVQNPNSSSKLRSEQSALSEVEFEWIRQFYVQGSKHFELHLWWQAGINALIQYWNQLNTRTIKALEALYDASGHCFYYF